MQTRLYHTYLVRLCASSHLAVLPCGIVVAPSLYPITSFSSAVLSDQIRHMMLFGRGLGSGLSRRMFPEFTEFYNRQLTVGGHEQPLVVVSSCTEELLVLRTIINTEGSAGLEPLGHTAKLTGFLILV